MQSSEVNGKDFGRAMCIITGASRGLGRTISKDMSLRMKPGSVLVLVARSGDELQAVKLELEAAREGVQVRTVQADLSLMDGVKSVITTCREAALKDMEHLILINNAASLGDVSRFAKSFTDMSEVNAYLSFNVSSALCLTSSVLQAVPQCHGQRRTVVNISSLCALEPFPSWVLYCTGKAARDMMFSVIAKEEPNLRILNYAPGPLDTAMFAEAKSKTSDPGVKKAFSDMFTKGQVLTCEASCAKLMKVLLQDEYTSGAHLDFFDL
ncbi:sepiapterin reductase-like [Genypterus blacodes]|uniref:sepiapterin reductase-like n=1 Tax=Genypterus blacodes TaxID=154954 RepID=UPI003F7773FA